MTKNINYHDQYNNIAHLFLDLKFCAYHIYTHHFQFFIGASPTLAGCPHNFGVVNHAKTTTDKTGKLTIGFPCRSEIHGVDYCTSLFGLCRQPCHGELHGKPEKLAVGTFIFISHCYRTLVWTTEVAGSYTHDLRKITRFIHVDLTFS